MSDTVIRVENLSKRYKIGLQEKRTKTLGQAVKRIVHSPFTYLSSVLREPTPEEVFWALQNVSFEVKRGDVVGIIGRNGAGKSTLLKILSKITEPTSGFAEIRGRVGSLLEVGTGFHPDLTGRENTYLNGTIMGMRKREIDSRFDEIVDFAEVEKFIDTPVKHYSSGMYTRLAFAVAAHLTPEILIIDEVLAVGDIQFQKKCLGKMEDVSRNEGRTILFVSHNLTALQQLTKTGLVFHKGQLQKQAITSDAIEFFLNSSLENSIAVYDVENKPRHYPQLSRMVEFLTLEIENHPTKLVPADAEIIFKLKVRGNQSVARFRFSMTLFRMDGTPVGSFFSSDEQSIGQGEIAAFQLKVKDHRLAPGTYYCGLATGKGNHLEGYVDFDIVHDVLHFEIMPPEGIDGTRSAWSPGWGSIRLAEPVVTKISRYENYLA